MDADVDLEDHDALAELVASDVPRDVVPIPTGAQGATLGHLADADEGPTITRSPRHGRIRAFCVSSTASRLIRPMRGAAMTTGTLALTAFRTSRPVSSLPAAALAARHVPVVRPRLRIIDQRRIAQGRPGGPRGAVAGDGHRPTVDAATSLPGPFRSRPVGRGSTGGAPGARVDALFTPPGTDHRYASSFGDHRRSRDWAVRTPAHGSRSSRVRPASGCGRVPTR
jgi:hypothetical protein